MEAGGCMGRGWSRSCSWKPPTHPSCDGEMVSWRSYHSTGKWGDLCAGLCFHLEKNLQELLIPVMCLGGCTLLLGWNSCCSGCWARIQWYLIPDFNMAFWFSVTELLNLLRPQSPCEKMSLTVCCMGSWLLRHAMSLGCHYLCTVPSTVGAKIYLL